MPLGVSPFAYVRPLHVLRVGARKLGPGTAVSLVQYALEVRTSVLDYMFRHFFSVVGDEHQVVVDASNALEQRVVGGLGLRLAVG